jgi:hypothetical protein
MNKMYSVVIHQNFNFTMHFSSIDFLLFWKGSFVIDDIFDLQA